MNAAPPVGGDTAAPPTGGDTAALARGGRTNFLGFLLRLAARLPFLFIAGRLYGAAALGRFASALVVIDVAGQLCSLGQKRGLAKRLVEDPEHPANVVADGVLLATLVSGVVIALLLIWPAPMFPHSIPSAIDRLLPLAILPTAQIEVALAALAYRYDVATTVRARSVVEPWTLSISAGVIWFVHPLTQSGLSIAYIASIYFSWLAAALPLARSYGRPRGWVPHPARIARLGWESLPLAAADAIEWGTRRLDIFLLEHLASPVAVGVYYVAQQVASLPQKLKTSFEPVLSPVITAKLKTRDFAGIARRVCQVGFWITAAQAGIALALGIPAYAVMALVGSKFVHGTEALGFLLAAEVVAATAVVSEAVLIYIAPRRNLAVSLATIAAQGALTETGFIVCRRFGLDDYAAAATAAAALMTALGIASLVKARMLSKCLDAPINNWRWPLLWAAVPACVLGWAIMYLPQWLQLVAGIPGILGVYSWVIWRRGFGPEDRLLFTRKVAADPTAVVISPIAAEAPA